LLAECAEHQKVIELEGGHNWAQNEHSKRFGQLTAKIISNWYEDCQQNDHCSDQSIHEGPCSVLDHQLLQQELHEHHHGEEEHKSHRKQFIQFVEVDEEHEENDERK